MALAAVFAILPAGCASRYRTDANAPTYAAKAQIRVDTNRDQLRDVKITVDHLAPPKRINPAFSHYVVFFEVPGHPIQRAGVLDYNAKRRRGTLRATTPHSNFHVIISLESVGSIPAPTPEQVIVHQRVGNHGFATRWGSG